MTSSKARQTNSSDLSRRDFLKLVASGTLSSFLPPRLRANQRNLPGWPLLTMEELPVSIMEIMQVVPDTLVRPDGHLALFSRSTGIYDNVRLAPTQWNIENSHPWNELDTSVPWGIVLHWFGDRFPEQDDPEFYLRGFNGVRQIDETVFSTSAHFLVGDSQPEAVSEDKSFAFLQTQKPGPGGIQYEAAHMRYLDYDAYREGQHYFILALKELNKKYPHVRSILQTFFDQPGVYPHMRTIGVEITGFDFDNPQHHPGAQKIANVVSLVWALMKRYNISANNLTGHFEIQLSKPDPGKKFLALIKYLMGIKALLEKDEDMCLLVFGQFTNGQESPKDAVLAYFSYLREYLMLTATPRQVSEWDAWSKYFLLFETIQQGSPTLSGAKAYYPPVVVPCWEPGYRFLVPDNHEGIDIYPDHREISKRKSSQDVHLLASGICIYLGRSNGLHDGQLAVFRHRQVDGSEVISLYGHLTAMGNLEVNRKYCGGQVIGQIATPNTPPEGFLHFSLAYGPSWDIYLHKNASIPLNVGPSWIKNYFINPSRFFADKSLVPGEIIKDSPYTPL